MNALDFLRVVFFFFCMGGGGGEGECLKVWGFSVFLALEKNFLIQTEVLKLSAVFMGQCVLDRNKGGRKQGV